MQQVCISILVSHTTHWAANRAWSLPSTLWDGSYSERYFSYWNVPVFQQCSNISINHTHEIRGYRTLYLLIFVFLMITVCLKSITDVLCTGTTEPVDQCCPTQSLCNDKKSTNGSVRNAKVIAGLSQRQPSDNSSLLIFYRFITFMGIIVTNLRSSLAHH